MTDVMSWPTEHLGDPQAVCPPGCIGVDCAAKGHRHRLNGGLFEAVAKVSASPTWEFRIDGKPVGAAKAARLRRLLNAAQ